MFGKVFLFLMPCLLLAMAYQDIDDNADYDAVLKNKDAVKAYFLCFIDQGPCTDTTSHIKAHLRQITTDGCNECDKIQKHYAHAFMTVMKDDFPDLYEIYKTKYDPDGNHVALLAKAIADY